MAAHRRRIGGGDTITLENYARNREDAALSADNPVYHFAMYGPPSKPTQTCTPHGAAERHRWRTPSPASYVDRMHRV